MPDIITRNDNVLQIRSIANVKYTTREADGKKFIEGYFSVFDSNYELWEGATESVDPHAFDEAIQDDVRALVNHDTTLVLGRNRAGTLTFRIDAHGLWGSIEINTEDGDAMNLYARVKRGDVSQCSFGFNILSEKYEHRADGTYHWTILSVRLFEVSVCTFPAYEQTEVSARKKDLADIEKRKIDLWREEARQKLKGV